MDKLKLYELRTQEEIMASWKGGTSKPLVSVLCTTYNHEDYIEDALVGFLMQETNFSFHIISLYMMMLQRIKQLKL